jgi:hypothetical protein
MSIRAVDFEEMSTASRSWAWLWRHERGGSLA